MDNSKKSYREFSKTTLLKVAALPQYSRSSVDRHFLEAVKTCRYGFNAT
jgi:hypothetical protein